MNRDIVPKRGFLYDEIFIDFIRHLSNDFTLHRVFLNLMYRLLLVETSLGNAREMSYRSFCVRVNASMRKFPIILLKEVNFHVIDSVEKWLKEKYNIRNT